MTVFLDNGKPLDLHGNESNLKCLDLSTVLFSLGFRMKSVASVAWSFIKCDDFFVAASDFQSPVLIEFDVYNTCPNKATVGF